MAASSSTSKSVGDCTRHSLRSYGMDIGGTLVKLVCFESLSEKDDGISINEPIMFTEAFKDIGIRDSHLEMKGIQINNVSGNIHFCHFPTDQMENFIKMAKEEGFSMSHNIIYVTGGGAHKFEKKFRIELSLKIHKLDEVECLIKGIHFINSASSSRYAECFSISGRPTSESGETVKIPFNFDNPFPYLVCNIGSGVSITMVRSTQDWKVISGSPIGGGTFLGLCCLLIGCETFDGAIALAGVGTSTKIDTLVRDVYGDDCDKLGVTGDTISSSFGKMSRKKYRDAATREDLAATILLTITNNICEVVKTRAVQRNMSRVMFVGNFLRRNEIAMKSISCAMNNLSEGKIAALFCEHEGYLGAVGALSATPCDQNTSMKVT